MPDRPLNIFEKHPRRTIILTILIFILIADYVVGILFIPTNYNRFRCPHHYYHHGLEPNQRCAGKWGELTYSVVTNSLGFRDRSIRNVPLKSDHKRIVFIGDSFTECLGVDYEQSFVGILGNQCAKANVEILNAAVVSYSPKLYYLKIKYLIEEIGLDFDELYVFVDNSDIPDEICYEKFEPQQRNTLRNITYKVSKYFESTSVLYYSIHTLLNRFKNQRFEEIDGLHPCFAPIDNQLTAEAQTISAHPVLYWTISEKMFNLCGRRGLELSAKNMAELVNLCKDHDIQVTIIIYPWPHQITHRDLESVQVGFWRHFCRVNKLVFINLFPLFINDTPPEVILDEYFIDKDVHWNTKGHIYVASVLAKCINH